MLRGRYVLAGADIQTVTAKGKHVLEVIAAALGGLVVGVVLACWRLGGAGETMELVREVIKPSTAGGPGPRP